MIGNRRLVMSMVALLAIVPCALLGGVASGQTIRAVMHADVKHTDPHFTTANITANYGYMIYDTLFAPDAKGNFQPQMVDTYTLSADKRTYTFTLRDGLRWHDGKPVRSADVVASLKRWGSKDSAGQALFKKTASLEIVNDKRFVLQLNEPYGLTLHALGKVNTFVPFILPERHAVQSADKAFEGEKIGSGPFVFDEAAWVPGSKAVFRKFKDYVPRNEPASYYAGGKRVKVDTVEWIVLPDAATAVAALERGEIDFYEAPQPDQYPVLLRHPAITLQETDRYQPQIHPNHLFPPFNNLKARQALMLVTDQEEYLRAMAGDEGNWIACKSYLLCGSYLETDVGNELLRQHDVERARQLMKESGYAGETVVIIAPSDIAYIHAASLVTAANLRKIGVKVDLQVMDWGTLTSRRPVKEPPSVNRAGWHIFHTSSPSTHLTDPWGNPVFNTRCADAWYGWPCSEKADKALGRLGETLGTSDFPEALRNFHLAITENIPYVPLGEVKRMSAWRKDRIHNMIYPAPFIIFWNVTKS